MGYLAQTEFQARLGLALTVPLSPMTVAIIAAIYQ
jgi:hypothetical protein